MSSPENNQAPTQVARKCYSVDSGRHGPSVGGTLCDIRSVHQPSLLRRNILAQSVRARSDVENDFVGFGRVRYDVKNLRSGDNQNSGLAQIQ